MEYVHAYTDVVLSALQWCWDLFKAAEGLMALVPLVLLALVAVIGVFGPLALILSAIVSIIGVAWVIGPVVLIFFLVGAWGSVEEKQKASYEAELVKPSVTILEKSK